MKMCANMILINYIYIDVVIMTRSFYSHTLLFNPLPVVNVLSIFRNDKKVYLQFKMQMPRDNWPVSAIFILWLCNNKKDAGQYS